MNNIQKAFKNKAKCGLRLAVGGVVLSDQPAPQTELSTSVTPVNTNPIYKAGKVGDPHASGLSVADSVQQAKLFAPPTASPSNPVPTISQPDLTPSTGLAKLKADTGLRAGFADGGVVETPEQLIARMAAKYGTTGAAQAAPQPQPVVQPAQQPAQQPSAPQQPVSGGMIGNTINALRAHRQALNSFADGGVVQISGPGTGTSDDIPAKVRDKGKSLDIDVSNGEALAVLPAKTARNPEAIDAVNDVIRLTNGKEPKGLRAGGNYEDGSIAEAIRKDAAVPPVPNPNILTNTRNASIADAAVQPPVDQRVGLRSASTEQAPRQLAPFPFKDPNGLAARAEPGYTPKPDGVAGAPQTPSAPKADSPVVPIPQAQPAAAPEAKQPDANRVGYATSLATNGMRDVSGLRAERDQFGTIDTARFDTPYDAAAQSVDATRGLHPMDERRLSDGHGVASMRQANGTYKNIVVGPSQYKGVDGKATNKWEDTQAYKDAIAKNVQDKSTLREMQIGNAIRSLGSPHEMYQQQGLRQATALLGDKQLDATAASAALGNQLKLAELQRGLRKDGVEEARDQRNFNDKQSQDADKLIADEFKAAIGEDKDGSKLAALHNYANTNFRYDPKVSGNARNHAQNVINNFKLESSLSDIASRFGSHEKDFNGIDKSEWEFDPTNTAGGVGLRPGTWGGGGRFLNKKTGQVVSERELRQLPEELKNSFWSRVKNLPHNYVK